MDIDENSLDSSVEQHQNSKTAHTPSNLKSELTNGTFGMEAEDSDHSNEVSSLAFSGKDLSVNNLESL